jgi:predicted nucleic acid-binding protein
MKIIRRLITLDANILVAALKRDEPHSQTCVDLLNKIPDMFIPSEPSIIYQEVCGTLARTVDPDTANLAKEKLDHIIHPLLLVKCDKDFCTSAYQLCHEYKIYSIDALYLAVALQKGAILVSLDKEDFTDRVKAKNPPIEVYHVTEIPY